MWRAVVVAIATALPKLIMEHEVDGLTGQCIEWRSETCEVAVAKRVRSRSTDRRLPIRRPRVRGTEGERKVGGANFFGAMNRGNAMFGIASQVG